MRDSPLVTNYHLRKLAGFDAPEPPAALPEAITWADHPDALNRHKYSTRRVWINALEPRLFYSDLHPAHFKDTFDAFAVALAMRLKGAQFIEDKVPLFVRSAEGVWGLVVATEFIPSPVHRDDDLAYQALARWVDQLEPEYSVWEPAG